MCQKDGTTLCKSMFYSEEIIEEVRERNPIADVIGSYIHLTKKGGNYFGVCPFHNEKTPSFSVSPSRQMYHCFGCSAGGNVISFVMQYENLTFPEALKVLADRAGMTLPEVHVTKEQRAESDLRTRLLAIHKDAAIYYVHMLQSDKGKIGKDYFLKRGLSEETIRSFGLGYTGQYSGMLYKYLKGKGYTDNELKESGLVTINENGGHDKFWNRVMFPILDTNNRVIAFGGRVMGDGEPKYLNSPETKLFDKSRNLYGLHVAKKTREKFFLICEGYMDVISMHQAGFTNSIASLGTAFTEQHGHIIKRYLNEVILCYDSDGAGKKAALRAIPILRKVGLKVSVLNLSPYKDPDEFMKKAGKEEFINRIQRAMNGFLFEVSALRENYDFEDPQDKANFFNETARMLSHFTDEIERNSYIEAVANTFGYDYGILRKKVAQIGNQIGFSERPDDEWKPKKEARLKTVSKENGFESEKLVFADLLETPSHFAAISAALSPEEFGSEVTREIAKRLFDQLAMGKTEPAKIPDAFTKEEDLKKAAEALSGAYPEELSKSEKESALIEAISRVKSLALEKAIDSCEDPTELKQLMDAKTALRSLTIKF